MTEKVLIVLHQEQSTPGRVGNALRDRGYDLDIRRPRFGDPLPDHDGGACRRGDLRRPAERQRSGRLHQGRDRLHRRAAARGKAVSRHLPRRADAGAASRRARRAPIPKARPRSATIRSGRRRRAARSATGRPTCISGIARASTCRAAPSCSPRATSSRSRRSATGTGFAIQFHAEVTHAMMCRWTTRGAARMEIARRQAAPRAFRRPPGLRPRHPRLAVGFPRPLARDRRAAPALVAAGKLRADQLERTFGSCAGFQPQPVDPRELRETAASRSPRSPACRCRRSARPAPRRASAAIAPARNSPS